MLPPFHVSEDSPVPVYRQLHEHIARLIRRGVLPHGTRIPPTREVAGQFGLARTTVLDAYGLLEEAGLIQGHVGRGSFVHYEGPVEAPEPETRISFGSSQPDPALFPLADFQKTCREVLSTPDLATVLQLGSPAGYNPLRRWLGARLDPGDDILVTSGCQQALDLLQRVLAPAGSTVVVEDPVYHGVRNVFERAGVRLIGVRMSEEGILVDEVHRICLSERPKMVVLTPDFQNPTGVTMTSRNREAIARTVRELGVVVVENAIYRDLRYTGQALPTIKEMDVSGNVVLIRSFSKVAFPGVRVGWVTASAKIIALLAEARQWCDLHTDHLSQAILLRFAESGRLEKHLKRVREHGKQRLAAMLRGCQTHLPYGSEWTHPAGGMHIWVSLPRGLDASELLPAAERAGVSYVPGRQFGVQHQAGETLRLSFGGLSPERIEEGMAILEQVFKGPAVRPDAGLRADPAPALV